LKQIDTWMKDQEMFRAKEPLFIKEFGLYADRDFYIMSSMSNQRYLDIREGRDFVINTPSGEASTQVWYFDQKSETIKSKSNEMSWNIAENGRGWNLQIWYTNSGWFQKFKFQNGQFINLENKKVLEVANNIDKDG